MRRCLLSGVILVGVVIMAAGVIGYGRPARGECMEKVSWISKVFPGFGDRLRDFGDGDCKDGNGICVALN
jgi:hypothetical protein